MNMMNANKPIDGFFLVLLGLENVELGLESGDFRAGKHHHGRFVQTLIFDHDLAYV